MKITKVKYDGSRVRIEWTIGDTDDPDKHSLDCRQAPKQEFVNALTALVPSVVAICELPDDYVVGIEIRGVSFSWAKDIMGATITALKTLNDSDAPLVLNSPHKPSEPYSETGDNRNCLSAATVVALEEVLMEAERYVEGERAQGSLFEDRELMRAVRNLCPDGEGESVTISSAGFRPATLTSETRERLTERLAA